MQFVLECFYFLHHYNGEFAKLLKRFGYELYNTGTPLLKCFFFFFDCLFFFLAAFFLQCSLRNKNKGLTWTTLTSLTVIQTAFGQSCCKPEAPLGNEMV